jgi:hypothetical protein
MTRLFLRRFLLLIVLPACVQAAPESAPATKLLQRFQSLQAPLTRSVFNPPLVLESQEQAQRVTGDIYGSVNFRFAQLLPLMQDPQRWCEILLLLSNTKRCQTQREGNTSFLLVHVGGKGEEKVSPDAATRFDFEVNQQSKDYLDMLLSANSGPMGASRIHIHAEGVAVSDSASFLHLHYSYDTGWLARSAMAIYLETLGRGKVGFTPIPGEAGTPVTYIGGVRGVIERNVMRYFMGLNCALTHAESPPAQRFPAMATCWYNAEEQHPLQLHEMERDEYLTMKAHEYQAPDH